MRPTARAGARLKPVVVCNARRASVLLGAVLAACGAFSDAATRLAADIEGQAGRLGAAEGASVTIRHATPSRRGQCTGPYKVQVDKVGALVVWCFDAQGATVSSHSTSHHARFVDTRDTFIVSKAADEPLVIRLERRQGRALIVDVS